MSCFYKALLLPAVQAPVRGGAGRTGDNGSSRRERQVSEALAPAAARRKMIADRQRTSAVWRIIHWLGSLQLALILLGTIAIACAVATFTESSFDTKVAQTYIYKAPWFVLWLGVLCINLLAVTLTRWPWQKKHTGFIITHYGIITLLIGAIVGLNYGFEGNVTIHKDKPPATKVTVNRSIIQVESPVDSALYIMSFDASTAGLSEKNPRTFSVPGTGLRIIADASSNNLIEEEKIIPSDQGAPGVLLRLTSARMSQSVDLALVLNGDAPREEDFFGLAKIRFQPALPTAAKPEGKETQMVFGRFAPVVQSETKASGVRVLLSEDGRKVTLVAPDQTSATYLREDLMNKPVATGTAIVTIENYWPDFEMKDGRPATKSALPNNPAALVRIQTVGGGGDAKPSLLLAPDKDGIAYQLLRGGTAYASGVAAPGKPFSLGWADWQAEVVEFYPKAASVTLTKPGPELPKGESGVPGFRARLESPELKSAEPRWVASGEVTSLTDGKHVVRIGYGLELRPLPFSLRLVDFEVPRYEGTEKPSNFIASVEFTDLKTGATKSGTAKMNHPASFPGTLAANLTGINYKFSQAEWNPRDLGETTLQVLYDPGWLFKWVGSLGICIGIATMFYFKPGSHA